MDTIRTVYDEFFQDSFDELGLRKYEEMDGPGMGALIKFKNDAFKLQILSDRGQIEVELSSLHGDEQYRGIDLFYSLFWSKDENLSQSERRKVLRTRIDYAGQSRFLLDKFTWLGAMLNERNYVETMHRIDTLGRELSEP